MQRYPSLVKTCTLEDFIEEVLSSPAFVGVHPVIYEDANGTEFRLMLFAMKCPVSGEQLIAMMHVLVDSIDIFEQWRGGRRPTDAELAAVSPAE